MESNLNYHEENEYPLYIYINLFFVFIGLISYLLALSLFYLYFNLLSFIKKEIFTFIILNSFQSFLEIIVSSSLIKELIMHCFGCINFYLILSYINKCIKTKKIDQNNQNISIYELDLLFVMIILYIIFFFPFEKVFKLAEILAFSFYTLRVILIIFLFRDINIKMQVVLEYLKDKKMKISSKPDIYLSYMKLHFYHNQFIIINNIFDAILVLSISYYIIKILDLLLQLKFVFVYVNLIIKKSIYCSIVMSGLIFFYSLNKNKLIKGGKKSNKTGESNIGKFNVIEVDIQQDDNTNLSERKRIKERKKESNLKLDKNDENDDNDEEEEKEKVNYKVNDESETLK